MLVATEPAMPTLEASDAERNVRMAALEAATTLTSCDVMTFAARSDFGGYVVANAGQQQRWKGRPPPAALPVPIASVSWPPRADNRRPIGCLHRQVLVDTWL